MADLLTLGRLVATSGALAACRKTRTDPRTLLERHARGDRGELGCLSADEEVGVRVASSYPLPPEKTVWVMTEADRLVTLLLLPEEF